MTLSLNYKIWLVIGFLTVALISITSLAAAQETTQYDCDNSAECQATLQQHLGCSSEADCADKFTELQQDPKLCVAELSEWSSHMSEADQARALAWIQEKVGGVVEDAVKLTTEMLDAKVVSSITAALTETTITAPEQIAALDEVITEVKGEVAGAVTAILNETADDIDLAEDFIGAAEAQNRDPLEMAQQFHALIQTTGGDVVGAMRLMAQNMGVTGIDETDFRDAAAQFEEHRDDFEQMVASGHMPGEEDADFMKEFSDERHQDFTNIRTAEEAEAFAKQYYQGEEVNPEHIQQIFKAAQQSGQEYPSPYPEGYLGPPIELGAPPPDFIGPFPDEGGFHYDDFGHGYDASQFQNYQLSPEENQMFQEWQASGGAHTAPPGETYQMTPQEQQQYQQYQSGGTYTYPSGGTYTEPSGGTYSGTYSGGTYTAPPPDSGMHMESYSPPPGASIYNLYRYRNPYPYYYYGY